MNTIWANRRNVYRNMNRISFQTWPTITATYPNTAERCGPKPTHARGHDDDACRSAVIQRFGHETQPTAYSIESFARTSAASLLPVE